ncbi:hypothetical protein GCM10027169_17080 [Gordonia jinhuaensis]|uniref:5-methylcytosine-specific restriction enzyme subunit McrC n=1 Tax=Gordonia jinhuaensis TaxID=1517702 RepID=A0A916TJ09_9ACTN|nr:restriction endonuclease [Gordonia jinhuaensis]GGB47658.1 hypothetical protein GCM10011489_38610 [Gordonia jinhuaensis]
MTEAAGDVQPIPSSTDRISLREERTTFGARSNAITEERFREELMRSSDRLGSTLRLKQNPIAVTTHGGVRVEGIAGIVRLTDVLELQIVPKFLDEEDPSWQDDFFVLALLSQTGRILPAEQIRAGNGERGDLATLVARTMVQMYWELHRRPLRTYRRRQVERFAYDGDVDPISLVLPEPDGFTQTVTVLARDNDPNAVIASAAGALLTEVADGETRQQLSRLIQSLAPQRSIARASSRKLPARQRSWQTLYDLSVQVLNGFGLTYKAEHLLAPGYVMRTWPTWQTLCETALRTGLGGANMQGSPVYVLGSRHSTDFRVYPDVVVTANGVPTGVVDAKYRTHLGRNESVDNGDVYETLAFLRATGTTRAALLYPRPAHTGPALPVGTCETFETVTVGKERIAGITVECRGISKTNGFNDFAKRVGAAVSTALL